MSIRKLPRELQLIAEEQLKEKPNEVQASIRIIQEWIQKERHLNARTDDQWILTYLRGCKFSLENTKQKINYYYRLRSIAPEIFKNRDPLSPQMSEFLDKKLMLPLTTNLNGPQVFLSQLGAANTDHISLLTMTKMTVMIFDVLLNENDYLMMGQYLIIDLKGMNLSRLVELSVNQLKVIVSMLHAYPVRIKRVIFLNFPYVVMKLIELIKSWLSMKIAERIYIFPDNATELLETLIPISILPKEYGGEACSNKLSIYWKNKMEDYKEWFLEDARYGTDESKRVLVNPVGDHFGVHGSFKKLEVD